MHRSASSRWRRPFWFVIFSSFIFSLYIFFYLYRYSSGLIHKGPLVHRHRIANSLLHRHKIDHARQLGSKKDKSSVSMAGKVGKYDKSTLGIGGRTRDSVPVTRSVVKSRSRASVPITREVVKSTGRGRSRVSVSGDKDQDSAMEEESSDGRGNRQIPIKAIDGSFSEEERVRDGIENSDSEGVAEENVEEEDNNGTENEAINKLDVSDEAIAGSVGDENAEEEKRIDVTERASDESLVNDAGSREGGDGVDSFGDINRDADEDDNQRLVRDATTTEEAQEIDVVKRELPVENDEENEKKSSIQYARSRENVEDAKEIGNVIREFPIEDDDENEKQRSTRHGRSREYVEEAKETDDVRGELLAENDDENEKQISIDHARSRENVEDIDAVIRELPAESDDDNEKQSSIQHARSKNKVKEAKEIGGVTRVSEKEKQRSIQHGRNRENVKRVENEKHARSRDHVEEAKETNVIKRVTEKKRPVEHARNRESIVKRLGVGDIRIRKKAEKVGAVKRVTEDEKKKGRSIEDARSRVKIRAVKRDHRNEIDAVKRDAHKLPVSAEESISPEEHVKHGSVVKDAVIREKVDVGGKRGSVTKEKRGKKNRKRGHAKKEDDVKTGPGEEGSAKRNDVVKGHQTQGAVDTKENTKQAKDHTCDGKYIYIHDLPGRFNQDMLTNCRSLSKWFDFCPYLENLGLGPHLNSHSKEFSPGGWFDTNQFALEVIFHQRMKQYKCLTRDSSKASAIYVPYYAGLDVSRYLWHDRSLKDSTSQDLVRWLRDQLEWDRMWGRDHFFLAGRITWDFRREGDNVRNWGNKLMFLPESKNMTILTIESSPWNRNDFAIPYPTYFHPRNDLEISLWQKKVRKMKRKYLFSFAGAPRPNLKNSIRGEIISQCHAARRKCKLLECARGNKCYQPVNVMQMFESSVFCLQPPGDSFTRRSAFDAILAGCIPVFFHPGSAYVQYIWHFPKDYNKYSVWIPGKDVKEGKVSIEKVLRDIPKRRVVAMREQLIRLIPKIVYADPGSRRETQEDAFDIAVKGVLDRINKTRTDMEQGTNYSFGFNEENAWKFYAYGMQRKHPWDHLFDRSPGNSYYIEQ